MTITAKTIKTYITKSKAGHYTVTIKDVLGCELYCRRLISSLEGARCYAADWQNDAQHQCERNVSRWLKAEDTVADGYTVEERQEQLGRSTRRFWAITLNGESLTCRRSRAEAEKAVVLIAAQSALRAAV